MSNRFTEQPSRKKWTTQGGWQTVRTWQGPSEDQADFEANDLPGGYTEYELESENLSEGHWFLTISTTYGFDPGAPEPPPEDNGLISRVWTLDPSRSQQTAASSPNAQTIHNFNPDYHWIAKLQVAVDAWRSAWEAWTRTDEGTEPDISGFLPEPPPGASAALTQLAGQFVMLLMKTPNASFTEISYSLRKTETVTTYAALKAVHANVGKIHTYPKLTAAEPTLPAAALLDAAGLGPYLWYKHAPVVREAGRGQFQIEQEYEGTLFFEPFLYDYVP